MVIQKILIVVEKNKHLAKKFKFWSIMRMFKKLSMLVVFCMFLRTLSVHAKPENIADLERKLTIIKVFYATCATIALGGTVLLYFFSKSEDDKFEGQNNGCISLDALLDKIIEDRVKKMPEWQQKMHLRTSMRFILHPSLTVALHLRESIDHINDLIERGANVNPGKFYSKENSLHDVYRYSSGRKELAQLLIKNGVQVTDDKWVREIVAKSVLQKHREINNLLNSIKKKGIKNANGDIRALLRLIEDEKTPVYDKQTAIALLFAVYKNQEAKPFTQEDLKKCLRQMQFNYRFFNCRECNDIVEYALEHNLKDIYGKSILYTSAVYGKYDIALRALMNTYNDFSYNNSVEQKQEIENEIVKTFNRAKKKSKELYIMLRNINIVWNDLKNIKEDKLLEPALAGKIINFAGAKTFRRKKIYHT